MPESDLVTCLSCNNQYAKDDLQRSCGNCFACTGCEIYICPNCRRQIVIKPVKKPQLGKSDQGK